MDETTATRPAERAYPGCNREADSTWRHWLDFDRLVAEHQDRIGRLAHRLLDGTDGVEDVIQEVFLAALRNLHRFRGDAKLSTWLSAIAVNRCRSHHRRETLRRKFLSWLAVSSKGEKPTGNASEDHEDVRQAVHRLPARYREPIVLRYFEELPIDEIAEILGLKVNAVEVRLSRARSRLKTILENRSHEEER